MKKSPWRKFQISVLTIVWIIMGLTTESGIAKQQKTFAIVYPVVNPFFDGTTRNAEAMAGKLGCKLLVKGPETFDIGQQIAILKNLIALKVDGIAIGPTDGQVLAPVINSAVDKGIKVVCFDTDCPSSRRLSFIGTDNMIAGKHMGEVVAKILNYAGKVICSQGIPSQLNLQQRLQGVQDIFKKYPRIKMIDVRSGQGDSPKTLANIEDMIKAHPDFDILIGMDSFAGPQAVMAWKEKGVRKPVVTFDDLPEIIQGIRDGQITVAIVQKQNQWGTLIMQRLSEACEGRKIPVNEDTGTIEVTRKNVDSYLNR